MALITGIDRSGKSWTPEFVTALNRDECIGCGRCIKGCGRDVLEMIGLDEDGDEVDAFDDEVEKRVMTIKAPENCIGCLACARLCPKGCYTHEALEAAA